MVKINSWPIKYHILIYLFMCSTSQRRAPRILAAKIDQIFDEYTVYTISWRCCAFLPHWYDMHTAKTIKMQRTKYYACVHNKSLLVREKIITWCFLLKYLLWHHRLFVLHHFLKIYLKVWTYNTNPHIETIYSS